MTEEASLKEKVRDIVNKYDPIGLLKIDCPVDEYDPEIQQIVPKISELNSVDKLQKVVYKIFVDMFDESIAGSKENYRQLSEELYSLRKVA